jgi:hypothetical protein
MLVDLDLGVIVSGSLLLVQEKHNEYQFCSSLLLALIQVNHCSLSQFLEISVAFLAIPRHLENKIGQWETSKNRVYVPR